MTILMRFFLFLALSLSSLLSTTHWSESLGALHVVVNMPRVQASRLRLPLNVHQPPCINVPCPYGSPCSTRQSKLQSCRGTLAASALGPSLISTALDSNCTIVFLCRSGCHIVNSLPKCIDPVSCPGLTQCRAPTVQVSKLCVGSCRSCNLGLTQWRNAECASVKELRPLVPLCNTTRHPNNSGHAEQHIDTKLPLSSLLVDSRRTACYVAHSLIMLNRPCRVSRETLSPSRRGCVSLGPAP